MEINYETGKKCENEFHKIMKLEEINENLWNTVKSFTKEKNRHEIVASKTISM